MNATASHRPTRGWRSGSSVGTVLVAASAWLSGSVWAANAQNLDITYLISPEGQISASRVASASLASQPTYISVHVSMTNQSTNTINQVRVNSSSLVSGGAPATYDSVISVGGISPTCSSSTASPSETQVSCSVGQMQGGATTDFFVIYKAPVLPDPPPLDPITVTISVQSTFSQGASPGTPTAEFPDGKLSQVLTLVTTESEEISKKITTVLPDTGTFFTGSKPDIVGPTNPFSTSVTVPSTKTPATTYGKQTVTTNSIDESVALSTIPCALNSDGTTYFCYGLSSEIEVLDAATGAKLYLTDDLAGPQITIVLTQDASSLMAKKPVPKIGDVKIFYTYPNESLISPTPATFTIEVGPCTNPGVPAKNKPCVYDRIDNFKANKGFYQYIIKALDNGRYTQ
jgi:hypothetical protein